MTSSCCDIGVPLYITLSNQFETLYGGILWKCSLAAFRKTASIHAAAEAAGIAPAWHSRWLEEDPRYAEAFADAHQEVVDALKDNVNRAGHPASRRSLADQPAQSVEAGEVSVAPRTCRRLLAFVSIPFSSGPSRETHPSTAELPSKLIFVSIPFSSGRRARHLFTYPVNYNNDKSRSPSHRGVARDIAVASSIGVTPGTDVSIPFSSGRRARPVRTRPVRINV